jgi:hypothetical protein
VFLILENRRWMCRISTCATPPQGRRVVGLPCETSRPSTPWLVARTALPFPPCWTLQAASSHQHAHLAIFVTFGIARLISNESLREGPIASNRLQISLQWLYGGSSIGDLSGQEAIRSLRVVRHDVFRGTSAL